MKSTMLLLLISATTYAASEKANYNTIYEAHSRRIGEVVARYIKTHDDPCLIIEVLDPDKKWIILSRKKICSINGKSFIDQVTYSDFEKITFSEKGIKSSLLVFPLLPAARERYDCLIPIKGQKIGALTCSEPTYEYD
ncbi:MULTISPECIES: hypothetical protein [unclassified Pseudomonas]|uniref:hypothetical protein n=1 Tax=unclassified Pseudomonas TaxID=196821 RepID=UPI0012FE5247|nr:MULTISPECIES: hypothetical protein [unclassified Pseudomonas]MCU1735915.1 hypothetical protein [Pseudomonas sp. 20S_6.2_Bac1]